MYRFGKKQKGGTKLLRAATTMRAGVNTACCGVMPERRQQQDMTRNKVGSGFDRKRRTCEKLQQMMRRPHVANPIVAWV